jgi:heptosyltransferase-1
MHLPSQPPRFLIVRLGSMGDVIHTLPAVEALRQAFPGAHIGWVIEERWSELLCTLWYPRSGSRSAQRPLVDRVHHVNTKTWRRSLLHFHVWEEMATSLSDLRGGHYDVGIDLQGAIRSAIVARLSKAPTIYGFTSPREAIATMFYTRQVQAEGAHVVEQNMSLVAPLLRRGTEPPAIELPRDPVAEEWCLKLVSEKTPARIALLNPGAGWGAKQWPVERYAAVAAALADDGVRVLVNYGPAEEELAQAVATQSEMRALPVRCSIAELTALTRRIDLCVGGDTGPMHLAAALKVPVVAIFGPTNPARNGPFGTRSVVLRSPTSITSHSRRVDPEAGLLTITVEQVIEAARQLLREER